ncbi:MAG TPA: response regulator [Cytophagales bacterium]|nr:response regulator [Cytophagales bacterium]
MKRLNCTLLVEDDSNTAFLNRMLLRDLKISNDIQIASNGEEAMKLLKNGTLPELILLDLNMPVMDGFEFLQSFRNTFNNLKKKTIIVLLASYYMKRDFENAREFQVSEIVQKPLTEDKIKSILKKFFE